jgi:crotonobetainyl-CoA:carnitine CoA-transferase CaiB-like acyl-CoA transferase
MKAGFVADTGDFNFLFELYNRNKRGIVLDLRVDESRPVFERLVESADVFITNFLPSARSKLRVTPDDLWKLNPKLVYAKGHGQGQRGPEADQGGFDAVSFWSRGGIGHILTPAEGPLVMPRGAFGDAPSGAMLAGGVGTALFHAARTGKGVVVDVALLATAVWQLSTDLTATAVLREEPKKLSATRSRLPSPMVGPYRTADDRWLMLNMLDEPRHWAPTCRSLGLEHLLDDERLGDTAARTAHAEELHATFEAAIASVPLAQLVERLRAEDTIFSTLASPLEVVDDPQVLANGYLAQHPTEARARLATAPMQYDDEMVEVRRPAPGVGEHTEEVLGEIGLSAEAVDELRAAGAVA